MVDLGMGRTFRAGLDANLSRNWRAALLWTESGHQIISGKFQTRAVRLVGVTSVARSIGYELMSYDNYICPIGLTFETYIEPPTVPIPHDASHAGRRSK